MSASVDRKTKTLKGFQFDSIDFDALIKSGEPCILKGALNDSRLVDAGKKSDDKAMSYLRSFASERPVLNYIAGAESGGRFFYNQAMDGLNFTREHFPLEAFFEKLKAEKINPSGTSFYVGSAELEDHFPGLMAADGLHIPNNLSFGRKPLIGIWLGNRTTAAAHFDVSNNIAACLVGRRRFTLFPPSQIENLYPGPLEPTPGGQVVSMVDINAPDFDRFPNARKALEQGEVAELEAGDVLVYPAMWWHQVEALNDFNVMVNYWWNPVPDFIDDPMNTLQHALLSLRDRPEEEKNAWRALFNFYIFGDSNNPRAHLPEHIWGSLGPMDEVSAKRLRARLLNKLNR